MTNQAFDPYHKWLGIPPEEQPPNLYRLLGVPVLETDLDVIEHAAARQISHLRSCSLGPNAEIAQNLLNEVAAARVTLLNPEKKMGYDAALLQAGWSMPQPRCHSLLNVSPHAPHRERSGDDRGC